MRFDRFILGISAILGIATFAISRWLISTYGAVFALNATGAVTGLFGTFFTTVSLTWLLTKWRCEGRLDWRGARYFDLMQGDDALLFPIALPGTMLGLALLFPAPEGRDWAYSALFAMAWLPYVLQYIETFRPPPRPPLRLV